jgi:hypothetical protein
MAIVLRLLMLPKLKYGRPMIGIQDADDQNRAQDERGDPGQLGEMPCAPSPASFAVIQFRRVLAAPAITASLVNAKRFQLGAPFVSWHRAQGRAGAPVPPLLVAGRVAPSDPVAVVQVFC